MSRAVPQRDADLSVADVEAVAECLRSGWLTMGPRTQEFEAAVRDWTGCAHAIAVSSGTAALQLGCAALGLGPGDEVIVPAFGFVGTAHAPRLQGATPVFCDVLAPEEPTLDPGDVERRITFRTRAVVAVHMCGYAADMAALKTLCDERGLRLIEDAAQALGAQVAPKGEFAGTVGTLGCLSFCSNAQLAIGEGGMVLTGDDELVGVLRRLRSHAMTSGTWDRHRGHEDSYDVVGIGFNFRLDEPRAALGLSRLQRVTTEIEHRRALARRCRGLLVGLDGVHAMWSDADAETGSHFALPLLFDAAGSRTQALRRLRARGVKAEYYQALHRLTAYSGFGKPGTLPNAEATAERHLVLPLSPPMSPEWVDEVVEVIADVL